MPGQLLVMGKRWPVTLAFQGPLLELIPECHGTQYRKQCCHKLRDFPGHMRGLQSLFAWSGVQKM
jgi:hypothetical protein